MIGLLPKTTLNKPPMGAILGGELSEGLLGAWGMMETAGPFVTDATGRTGPASLNNAPLWTPGRFGPTLTFNGTNQYLLSARPLNYTYTGKSFSFSAWIRPNFDSTSNTGAAIINISNGAGTVRSYWRYESVANGFYFDHVGGTGGGSSDEKVTGTTFATGVWHHIALCISPASRRWYWDGRPLTATVGAQNALGDMAGNNIYIGFGTINNYYWNGQLDNVLIHNRQLSGEEVSKLAGQMPFGEFRPQAMFRYKVIAAPTFIPFGNITRKFA